MCIRDSRMAYRRVAEDEERGDYLDMGNSPAGTYSAPAPVVGGLEDAEEVLGTPAPSHRVDIAMQGADGSSVVPKPTAAVEESSEEAPATRSAAPLGASPLDEGDEDNEHEDDGDDNDEDDDEDEDEDEEDEDEDEGGEDEDVRSGTRPYPQTPWTIATC